MVAKISKHSRLYARRWASGGRASAPTGITKRNKVNPDLDKYLKHNLPNPICVELEEDDFTRLEKAALTKDARAFEGILESVNWQTRPSSDLVRAIHLALGIGAYTAAQNVSTLAKDRHPDDPQIQKYAHVLAPPKVRHKKVEFDPTIRANRDWLMAHGDEYRGKWVALGNGELLDSADSFDELIKRVGNSKDILITTVF